MAYIHKKIIGNQTYYTLRISERKGDRVITKDICPLGTDLSKIKIGDLEKRYHEEIRKSYRVIKRFLESNTYEKKAESLKLKKDELLTESEIKIIEAARIHYTHKFSKLDKLSQTETFESFLIRFAVNSTAIEGNTIGLKDAARLIQEEILPKDHTIREVYDLTNTKKVFSELINTKPDIDLQLIIDIHDKLLNNIDVRKGFRNHDIHIIGQPFKPSPARYVQEDIKILLKWYKENRKNMHPFALAVLFHHKFESIHPFSDGNGRTGRMLMNHILILDKYPPIVVNRKDRKEYLEAMNEADRAIKNSLTKTGTQYHKLIKFMSKQLQQSYWDIFLV